MLFGDVQFGIDPVAFAVALMAIWFTWKESRRNNTVILKVRECKGSFVRHITRGDFELFEVWIQNRGISLFNVAVSLGFREKDGSGWLNCPLHSGYKEPGPEIVEAVTIPPEHHTYFAEYPEFARGMVGKFYLNSKEEGPGAERFLRLLDDPGKQEARLTVYAQDYLAYSFRIGGFGDRVKATWNRFACWFNNLFKHSHGLSPAPSPPGTQIIHIPEILPKFVTLDRGIMSFIKSLGRNAE